MKELTKGPLAAMLVLLLPVAAVAQEAAAPEVEPQESCTATIAPIQAAGQVEATATFDAPFGTVTEIKGPEKSGLKVVKVVEGDRAEMAAMAAEGDRAGEDRAELAENVSTFRIDASRTPPGTYDVVLKNEAGETCSAELIIQEPPGGDEW